MEAPARKIEIICVCSGKGGVGKTLFASSLGYALTRAGLRVLMVDGDMATDGLSLFLLGPGGKDQMESFAPANTLAGVINQYSATGKLEYEVRQVYRNGPNDHGVIYDALISGRYLYGQEYVTPNAPSASNANTDQTRSQPAMAAIPNVDRRTFQSAVRQLFDALRNTGEYDYVIVDTRGGFSFESTDLCALGDSFLVVVEADPTSFYQTSNLVQRIDEAAGEAGSKSVLRGFLINKAVDGLPDSGELDLSKVEWSFRNALIRQFPILKYSDTYPIPADLLVLQSYKDQMVPFLGSPASMFTYATLTAFSNIFQLVTSRWTKEQVQGWQLLVNSVAEAIRRRNQEAESLRKAHEEEEAEIKRLRETSAQNEIRIHDLESQIEQLRKESDLAHAQAAAELSRASAVETLVRSVSKLDEERRAARPASSFTIGATIIVLALGAALYWVWQSAARDKASMLAQETQLNQQTLTLQNQLAALTAQLANANGAPQANSKGNTLNAPPMIKQPIRVYIHMNNRLQYTQAIQVQKSLTVSGVSVIGTDVKQYSSPLTVCEVHYYVDDAQSLEDTGLIQKSLMAAGIPAISKLTSNEEKLQPRTYGVWLASTPSRQNSF